MGIFSMYTGLIYNDVFGKAFNIFGSAWVVNMDPNDTLKKEHDMLVPDRNYELCPNRTTYASEDYEYNGCGNYRQDPYPFGLDPVWIVAENKIVYLNSYKMKLSIILGVFHMTFGVVLNLWNFT